VRYNQVIALPLLFAVVAASVAAQQPTMNPAAARADSAFQHGAWQIAAESYRDIVRDSPNNGMGWFRLGTSLDQLGQNDDAIAAYERALTIGFQRGLAEFRLARVFARTGRRQEALDHLANSASAGAGPAMIDQEPAFASLRSTPEYAAIKKKVEDARFPCRAEHTFDFWIGDFTTGPWDLPSVPPSGQLHNTREYEGCVIVERFTANAGGAGMSMVFYDVNRKVWRMIWNDDSNQSNDFEGSYSDGAMRFAGWVIDASGKKILASNVLQDVSPGLIRHIYSTSADGGKTWIVRSDGRFTRKN
jgi:hypothetical protein